MPLTTSGKADAKMPTGITTAYLNTIPVEDQPDFPGDRRLERNIKNIVRWNALAMVLRANKNTNVGGARNVIRAELMTVFNNALGGPVARPVASFKSDGLLSPWGGVFAAGFAAFTAITCSS